MTPSELSEMAEVCGEREHAAEKERWRQVAFLAATAMNSSGRYRKTIKPDELLSFGEDKRRMTPDERDRRRAEAMETLKLHKAKCWTKFKDESVARLTGE